MTVDDKIGAVSLDARWVADKLSEYGFTVAQLEALYPSAEIVAREWALRGDTRIGIDLVTGEMKRRYNLGFSNTVRPFLARMPRDHLDVVGVVVRTPDGPVTYSLDEATALANRARETEAKAKRRAKADGAETIDEP